MKLCVSFLLACFFCSSAPLVGQTLFMDLNPGSGNSAVDHLTALPGLGSMVFIASNGINGVELWSSDGTMGGTSMVKDIYPGTNPSYSLIYHEYGGKVFFRSNDGTHGYELWSSDLTSGGTQLVKDANVGSANGVSLSTNGFVIGEAGGLMMMPLVDISRGLELWSSDGTTAGTSRMVDISPGATSSSPNDFVTFPSGMMFTAYEYSLALGTGTGRELWRTNGTAAGTVLVKDINPGLGNSDPKNLIKVGSNVIFSADDGTNGRELWISDGTTGGTYMLKDINPAGSSDPEGFTIAGGNLLFYADDGTHGAELWKTDGTPAGTVLVKDIYPGATSSKYFFVYATEMDGYFYFNATDGSHGPEPWRSDGTASGTEMVSDINNGALGSNPNSFFSHDSKLYFSAYDATDGFELWVSDGFGQTVQYMSFQPGTACGCPGDFVFFNSQLFFTANDGINGRELWSMSPVIGALPVSFLSFQAQTLDDGQVQLQWTTGEETNNDYFVVERSVDGKAFSPIAQVPGMGTSALQNEYAAVDVRPLAGRNYYRLRQVDLDGTQHYSSTVVVNLDFVQGIDLFPNPLADYLQINLASTASMARLQILNAQGQVVREGSLLENENQLDLSALRAGVYIVQIYQNGKVFRERVLKQ